MYRSHWRSANSSSLSARARYAIQATASSTARTCGQTSPPGRQTQHTGSTTPPMPLPAGLSKIVATLRSPNYGSYVVGNGISLIGHLDAACGRWMARLVADRITVLARSCCLRRSLSGGHSRPLRRRDRRPAQPIAAGADQPVPLLPAGGDPFRADRNRHHNDPRHPAAVALSRDRLRRSTNRRASRWSRASSKRSTSTPPSASTR